MNLPILGSDSSINPVVQVKISKSSVSALSHPLANVLANPVVSAYKLKTQCFHFLVQTTICHVDSYNSFLISLLALALTGLWSVLNLAERLY